jgi:hypothetical protein
MTSVISFRALADRDLTEVLWGLCGRDSATFQELESAPHNTAAWDQRAMSIKTMLRNHFMIDLDDPVQAYVFIMAASFLQMPLISMPADNYAVWARQTVGALRSLARTISEQLGEADLAPDAQPIAYAAHAAIEADGSPAERPSPQ